MSEKNIELTVSMFTGLGEDLHAIVGRFLDDVRDLGVDNPRTAPGEALPAGAKGDIVSVGGVIASLASAGVFTGLIGLIRAWVGGENRRKVVVKTRVGGNEVEATFSAANVDSAEIAELVRRVVAALKGSSAVATGGKRRDD
jgi:hypothetical protein